MFSMRVPALCLAFSFSATALGGLASQVDTVLADDAMPSSLEQAEAPADLELIDGLLRIDVPGAFFGASVSSAGDVNADGYDDLIIGAPNFSDGGDTFGAAYVKFGGDGVLNSTPEVMLDVDQVDSSFATVVAGIGDVNCDGHADLAAGAYRYVPSQMAVGSVFIYHGGPAFDGTPDLRLDGAQADAGFGVDVAGLGDVDNDGCDDLGVGAPNHDHGQGPSGAVFVYLGAAEMSAQPDATLAPDSGVESQFGWSLDGAGDVNGDGVADIVVGAFRYSNGEENEGAMMIYHGTDGLVDTVADLVLEGDAESAAFGFSVAGVGDLNGDGFHDIAVGAPFRMINQIEEGAAFVFKGSPDGIDPASMVTLQREQAHAAFGWDVAGGDFNADGFADLLVGAPFYDSGQFDEGIAQLYRGGPGAFDAERDALFQLDSDFAAAGLAVASAGDLNGDGVPDIVIGAATYQDLDTGGVAAVFLGDDTLFEDDFEPPNQ